MSDNVIDQNMSARNELHLFIFEGGSAEPLYVQKLEQNFMGGRISVKTVFDAEIYQLYELLKNEGFALDIVNQLPDGGSYQALQRYGEFQGTYRKMQTNQLSV